MPAIQTAYENRMPAAIVGLVANMETQNSITRIVEDAAGLAFGVPAFQGAADLGCVKLPTANTFLGVTIADKSVVMAIGGTVDTYPQKASAALLTLGVIWVTAGANVAVGAQAYAVATTGLWTSSSSGNIIIPGAFFDSTALSGALVKVRLR